VPPVNKATIIFTDNNDGGLEMQILFDPEPVNKESNAHIAAVLAYQYVAEKVNEADEDEPA
jgi:hypothetical protein